MPYDMESGALAYFKTLRSYVRHEDHLIMARLTWCLIITVLLILTLAAVLVTHRVPVVHLRGHALSTLYPATFMISLAGFVTSYLFLMSVRASERTRHLVNVAWAKAAPKLDPNFVLPAVLGGAPLDAKRSDKIVDGDANIQFVEHGSFGDIYVAQNAATLLLSLTMLIWGLILVASVLLSLLRALILIL